MAIAKDEVFMSKSQYWHHRVNSLGATLQVLSASANEINWAEEQRIICRRDAVQHSVKTVLNKINVCPEWTSSICTMLHPKAFDRAQAKEVSQWMGCLPSIQYANNKLINDVIDNISYSYLKKKGFASISLKHNVRMLKKNSTRLFFFNNGDRMLLVKAIITSNDVFKRKYLLINTSIEDFVRKYHIVPHGMFINVLDTDGFIQIRLHFYDKKIVRIEVLSEID